ncbi:Regulatory protein recX [Senna tora]|uniref:Regulatory protein RecX n=1 Tax=Senna tora TaxID=362788 RepID=A0A834T661_9FABA|nr:Regulatory protein recX [Senna tora]
MASFAGNIGFKISCQLQSRVYSIPWAIWRKNQITCLKSRNYNSSVPVKYIPKTSSKVKTYSYHNLLERGTNAELGCCEQMEEVEEDVEEMAIHQAGISCEQDLLQIDKYPSVIEELAIKLLAARALTTVELRKKLHGKRFSSDDVEAVINKFKSKGLINDRLYAESFSRSRWSSSSWGPRRIKLALSKKGVSQGDAEKAIELVFKEEDNDVEDQKSSIGLSKHSINHLYVQASKQWDRGHDVPKDTRKSRIIRWLQYRGFDWGVINLILRKLEKQDPH